MIRIASEFSEAAFPGSVLIYEYQRGVLFADGRFRRVLEPGTYRIYPFTRRRIVIVDLRQTTETIANQKLLTRDGLPVALTVAVDYRIADPARAVQVVQSVRAALHGDVQQAMRNVVTALSLEEVLAERESLNSPIVERLRGSVGRYGLEVEAAAVRDVILTPRVRDLVMKEAETRRLAHAALAGAREEIATLRAMANAARIVRDHPEILRLRELELMREAVQQGRHTFVFGQGVLPVAGEAPAPAPEVPGEPEA